MENQNNNGKPSGSDEKNHSFKITGDWNQQSKQIKANYSQLNDSDLKFETGKENELISRLEAKLGKKREEVISIIQRYQPTASRL